MAYNPFNIFRRNQKAIFAVITVFIMFTFVLSSGIGGGADFFDWLPRWLAGKTRKGDVVATLDGRKVFESELQQLRYQRVMANRFMTLAADQASHALTTHAFELAPRLSPEGQRLVAQFRALAEDPRNMGFLFQFFGGEIERLLSSPTAKTEDKEAARALAMAMSLFRSRSGPNGEHFFSAAPNNNNRDLVNFMIWQKKADQLGIQFTTDDVKRLIDRQFQGFFRSDVPVRKYLQENMTGFSMSKALNAIGEEFRVRAAQAAVVGRVSGGFPAFNTPFEVFEFYREYVSPTTYGVIPVPVANFLDKVPEPNENDPKIRAELNQLFDKYKDDEPNYARETPGFKEPRKIKLEWLSVTGAEPYYIKRAEEQLQAGELQAKVGSMMTVPFFGANPAWAAQAVGALAAKEPLVQKAYDDLVNRHNLDRRLSYGHSDIFLSNLLSSSVVRPGNLAAVAGSVGGQLLAFGHPAAAAAKAVSGPIAFEIRDRVKAGVPAVLLALGTIPAVGQENLGLWIGKPVPGLPGPMMFGNMIGAAAAYELMLPKPLPIEAVKPELMTKLIKDTAKKIAFGDSASAPDPLGMNPPDPKKAKGDLQTFIDEVNKLSDNGKTRDPKKLEEVRKFITEFAAQRGLTLGKSTDLRTEWTIEDDPALAPLIAAQKESLKAAGAAHQNVYIPFANSFFWNAGDRRSSTSGTYNPEFYPQQKPDLRDQQFLSEPKPQYVVWRTEDVPSKAVTSIQAAMPAVKAAWKRQKARELAKARAEQLASAIRASAPTSEVLLPMLLQDEEAKLRAEFTDPKAQDRTKAFLIEGIAPLTQVANPTAQKGLISFNVATALNPLLPLRSLPPSENVKYPSADMLKTLLEERTKPAKTTFVMTDAPKDTYYVTTLLKRDVKTDREFQAAVYDDLMGRIQAQRGMPSARKVILDNFDDQARGKTMESILTLLKKEFKYEETDEQKKKLDESAQRGEV